MTVLALAPPFIAGAKQLEAASAWGDPECSAVLVGGAIRSGKTQGAGRILVETALEFPSTYVVARLTYRELEDTTKKAMLRGDGDMPPLVPPEVIIEERASDNLVRLAGGSEILFRSLEEHSWGKLLNLTLGGLLIDQAEELDPGSKGEHIFDTLLGRLSDPRGPRKALLVANPGPTNHWLYQRFVDPLTRDPSFRYVHVTMRDNAANLPSDYVERMEATRQTRPHWYRCFVLGEWGSFEGAAFVEFEEGLHVVQPFPLPPAWLRFEALDYGRNHPTAWYLWAADYDGNLVAWDEYYGPGLVRDHAAEVLRRRAESWQARDERGSPVGHACYAPPDVKNRYGLSDWKGRELSVELEFSDFGISFAPGQNDRRAGYGRICELLHPEPGRLFPDWHPRSGEPGSPRLFFVSRCRNLIEQVRNAPVEDTGPLAGEAVDAEWEQEHGHSVAAARYGVMSRPGSSKPPEEELDDPRAAAFQRAEKVLQGGERYDWEYL